MSIIIKGRTVIGPTVPIVTDGLILHVDSANTRSYPGSGFATNDMAKVGEVWQMSADLTVSASTNGVYDYVDTYAPRYMITTNSFALKSDTSTLTFDYWCWLQSPRDRNSGNLFNDLAQQNGTPYVWVAAGYSHLEVQYLRTAGGWNATQFTNYFAGYTNTWVHVAVVIDYVTPLITAYRNGVLVSALTPPAIRFPTSVSKKYMGAYQGNYIYNWVGKQAVGKVYNRGLSETEIVQNYNALKTRFINK